MQKIKKARTARFYEGDPGIAAGLPIHPIKRKYGTAQIRTVP